MGLNLHTSSTAVSEAFQYLLPLSVMLYQACLVLHPWQMYTLGRCIPLAYVYPCCSTRSPGATVFYQNDFVLTTWRVGYPSSGGWTVLLRVAVTVGWGCYFEKASGVYCLPWWLYGCPGGRDPTLRGSLSSCWEWYLTYTSQKAYCMACSHSLIIT